MDYSGCHTLSREERRCLAAPSCERLLKRQIVHAKRSQFNPLEVPITKVRASGIIYKGASLDLLV